MRPWQQDSDSSTTAFTQRNNVKRRSMGAGASIRTVVSVDRMLALALATRHLQLPQPRPYFAELPYYLWGQVNYDSEGDCKKPTDRHWTWMYLQHRGTREVVDVKQENGEWLVDGNDETSARLAMFLLDRCNGVPDPSLVEAAGQWDYAAAVARTLPVRSEFEQPALASFDTKLFW